MTIASLMQVETHSLVLVLSFLTCFLLFQQATSSSFKPYICLLICVFIVLIIIMYNKSLFSYFLAENIYETTFLSFIFKT